MNSREYLVERLSALDCIMVEVCEPHPENPSRNIMPFLRTELLAALQAPDGGQIPGVSGEGRLRIEGDDEAIMIVSDAIRGADIKDAWFEGKTLTVLFTTLQLAKFRFVGLRDKPSAADLRGEPE